MNFEIKDIDATDRSVSYGRFQLEIDDDQ